MPLNFSCPQCGRQHSGIPRSLLGHPFLCPCGKTLQLGATAPGAPSFVSPDSRVSVSVPTAAGSSTDFVLREPGNLSTDSPSSKKRNRRQRHADRLEVPSPPPGPADAAAGMPQRNPSSTPTSERVSPASNQHGTGAEPTNDWMADWLKPAPAPARAASPRLLFDSDSGDEDSEEGLAISTPSAAERSTPAWHELNAWAGGSSVVSGESVAPPLFDKQAYWHSRARSAIESWGVRAGFVTAAAGLVQASALIVTGLATIISGSATLTQWREQGVSTSLELDIQIRMAVGVVLLLAAAGWGGWLLRDLIAVQSARSTVGYRSRQVTWFRSAVVSGLFALVLVALVVLLLARQPGVQSPQAERLLSSFWPETKIQLVATAAWLLVVPIASVAVGCWRAWERAVDD